MVKQVTKKGNEEAIKRALESGRSHDDIAADLADDGLLNNSHLLGSTERLIESNGETQDVIERATETAQKLQKLLTAIIPILVLIAGSGLELGGVIDVTPAGEGDDWMWEDDDTYYPDPVRYGCTDPGANNYDETAEADDGSCRFPPQNHEPHVDITQMESSLTPDGDMKMEMFLVVDGYFEEDIGLWWAVTHDGEQRPELDRHTEENPSDTGHVEEYWHELEDGEWVVRIRAYYPEGELMDDETFPAIILQNDEPEPVEGCTDEEAENYDEEAEEDDGSCTYPEPEPCEPEYYDAYVSYTDNNTTGIQFTYDVDISCNEEQEVTVQFLAYVNGSGHGEAPYNYTTDTYNTTYQDWDSRTVFLSDFENGSYDIYAYLINEDGQMIKEFKWFDVEMKARDE